MATMTEVMQDLHNQLRDVEARRNAILFALDQLARVTTLSETSAATRSTVASPRRREGGMVDRATNAINELGTKVTAEDAAEMMRLQGWDKEVKNEAETARTALIRAAQAGFIQRLPHGMFAPLDWVESPPPPPSDGDAEREPLRAVDF